MTRSWEERPMVPAGPGPPLGVRCAAFRKGCEARPLGRERLGPRCEREGARHQRRVFPGRADTLRVRRSRSRQTRCGLRRKWGEEGLQGGHGRHQKVTQKGGPEGRFRKLDSVLNVMGNRIKFKQVISHICLARGCV